jgi:hypothetical protein
MIFFFLPLCSLYPDGHVTIQKRWKAIVFEGIAQLL